jgi:hypothetical protein
MVTKELIVKKYMTPTIRNILTNSINVFSASTREEKENYIKVVEKNLNDHKNALEFIGSGFAKDTVQAGEIFLRLFKK